MFTDRRFYLLLETCHLQLRLCPLYLISTTCLICIPAPLVGGGQGEDGSRTLSPSTGVRILVPQPYKSENYMLEAKASFLVCVTWFGFMGGIWALSEAAETSVAVDTKTAVSRWLHNLDLTSVLPRTFSLTDQGHIRRV